MQARTFFLVAAAISVGYALAFLFVPQEVFALYGGKSDPAVLGYRYFAVALIGLGLVCWAMKDCSDSTTVQAILLGLGLSDVVGIFVSLWGTLSGALNALGWMNVFLYVGLAAWCIYLYRGRTQTARLVG